MEVKMDILARCNISEYYSDIPDNVYFKMDWYFDFLKVKKRPERLRFVSIIILEKMKLIGKKPVANSGNRCTSP